MSLKNIFKKDKDSGGKKGSKGSPEFTIIHSETNSKTHLTLPKNPQDHGRLSLDSRPSSSNSHSSGGGGNRLNFSGLSSRHRSNSSANVPADLPTANTGREDEWELRAAKLAQGGPSTASTTITTAPSTPPSSNVAGSGVDDTIQEAIRLHESGNLSASTEIFRRLADPSGANNPLSQVLYGLALRHGWGVETDLPAALTYLRSAARNSAAVEELALAAGMTKGGSAKGELVLAIFELGNCFRYGWGVGKDAVAAREYYETAANLGDADAMNEAAWCYLEGFGCRKDKVKSARFYRMAEKQGNKILGNTWIYKDKYMTGD